MSMSPNDFQSRVSPPMLFWHADLVSLKAKAERTGYITLYRDRKPGVSGAPIQLTVRVEKVEKPGF